jgi:DNA-binding transcriptional ArsR family regulator
MSQVEQVRGLIDADRPSAVNKQIFVAYSYKAYPAADYRRVFNEIAAEYEVSFVFADEKITNMHILQKIISYIRGSDFALFDISGWNPNVTLELGIAMASDEDWYIAFNPNETDIEEVPSDLRGIDRIQYTSYTELGEKLRALVEQRYPRRSEGIEAYLDDLRTSVRSLLGQQPGMTMQELAEVLGVSVAVAQLAVRPLIGAELETTGRRKGTKYYRNGEAPARPGSGAPTE